MSCHDCMIWIGQTYKSVEIFLREAERRGCCREVSSWPTWVVPGETRIFLAHRDSSVRSDQGSIFGYFQLHSVAITLSEPDYQTYIKLEPSPSKSKPGAAEFLNQRFRGNRLPVHTSADNGGGADSGAAVIQPVSEISWEPEANQAYAISTSQTALEEGRRCKPKRKGARTKEKAIYFVDKLAGSIDFQFQKSLKTVYNRIPRGNPQPIPQAELDKLNQIAQQQIKAGIQRGLPEFQQAVQAAQHTLKIEFELPSLLVGNAALRGCVVVFSQPFPTFRRIPSAAFRGIWRIDGDELIKRIASMYELRSSSPEAIREIKVPNCDQLKDEQEGKLTQAQMIAALSESLQINQSMARQILVSIEELIASELTQRGTIHLPRVGTFFIKEKDERKLVKFRPSVVLKRKISDLSSVQEG